jgi:hypothetical protein
MQIVFYSIDDAIVRAQQYAYYNFLLLLSSFSLIQQSEAISKHLY